MITSKEVLGGGRTAEVYEWEKTKIVKLYKKGWNLDSVKNEFKASNVARDLEETAPDVFEIVEVNGRHGIVFEKIVGPSMLKKIQSKPYKAKYYAKMMAELQYNLNQKTVPHDIPTQNDRLFYALDHSQDLSEDQKVKIKNIVKGDANTNLLHYDLHPDNIIVTGKGPRLIDWVTLSKGHPLNDYNRTNVLMSIALPEDIRLIERVVIKFIRGVVIRNYKKKYLKLSDYSNDEVAKYWLPNLVYRLTDDKIQEEREILLKMIDEELSSL